MPFKDNADLVNPDSDCMGNVNADNPDQDLEVKSHTSNDSPRLSSRGEIVLPTKQPRIIPDPFWVSNRSFW